MDAWQMDRLISAGTPHPGWRTGGQDHPDRCGSPSHKRPQDNLEAPKDTSGIREHGRNHEEDLRGPPGRPTTTLGTPPPRVVDSLLTGRNLEQAEQEEPSYLKVCLSYLSTPSWE